MLLSIARRLLPVALLAMAASITAQTVRSARPDPSDAAASVPPAAYRSALTGYQRYQEQPAGSWKEANDTVNRIGGWRVYAREASQPAAPSAAASAAKPASAPGHGGHKMN
jgi:hypothetical protein